MNTRLIQTYADNHAVYTASLKANQMPIIYKEIPLTNDLRYVLSTSHIWIERKSKRVKAQHNKDAWKMEHANYVALCEYLVFQYEGTLYYFSVPRYSYADDLEKTHKRLKYWEQYGIIENALQELKDALASESRLDVEKHKK